MPRWLPFYLITAVIWGFSFLFIMVSLEMFTPVGVAFGRVVLGGLTLVVIALITRTPFPPRWSWPPLFIGSLFFVSIPWMLFGFGETQVSSALAGIINGGTPLMTLLAILIAFPEERPTFRRVAGLLIGFIGILIVVGVWRGLEGGTLLGIGALLLAIACYGVGFPFARRYIYAAHDARGNPREPVHPISLTLGLLFFGFVVTGPVVMFTGLTNEPLTMSALPLAPILSILALGVLGSGIAYILNFTVIEQSDATTASTVTYLTPVIAVLAGAAILGEELSWNQPIGGVIVLLGAAIAQGLIGSRRMPERA